MASRPPLPPQFVTPAPYCPVLPFSAAFSLLLFSVPFQPSAAVRFHPCPVRAPSVPLRPSPEEPTLHDLAPFDRLDGLDRLNAADPDDAEAALLVCCGSRRWARRLAAHRPYPAPDALLAAADAAGHALGRADLSEAFAAEAAGAFTPAQARAVGALRAAHAAYERRFGHVFVICLDGCRPEEVLGRLLSALRARLAAPLHEEHATAAGELRRIARGRLTRLAQGTLAPRGGGPAWGVRECQGSRQ
ncbi:2-oxo-4-hydroxy-4-carboxy-5-ureidoimidazoline decarboxylase [Streptomyces netropsis]|uniref:2-oxo-4-hydroxy-4-carboxy-5-ureidoimidazoline decarboxylase n=1 Tax=Streptomyces netropsis TaxID=55404 RepID=UPI0030D2E2B4